MCHKGGGISWRCRSLPLDQPSPSCSSSTRVLIVCLYYLFFFPFRARMSSTSVLTRIAQQLTRRPLLQILSTTRPSCLPATSSSKRQHINAVFLSRSYATDDAVADVEVVVKKPRKPRAKSTEPKTPKKPKTPKAPVVKKPKKPKRELTEDEKIKKKVAELKKVAMLDQPVGLPVSAWTVFVTESKGTVSTIKSTAEAFSQLSDARKEVRKGIYGMRS